MTKKDYIKIAAILKDANKTAGNCKDYEAMLQCKAAVKLITLNLARVFEEDNERFNYDKFLEAVK